MTTDAEVDALFEELDRAKARVRAITEEIEKTRTSPISDLCIAINKSRYIKVNGDLFRHNCTALVQGGAIYTPYDAAVYTHSFCRDRSSFVISSICDVVVMSKENWMKEFDEKLLELKRGL